MQVQRYKPDEINLLPNEPGIYKYYDAEDRLIYVGKAKSLKKRVSSYFTKSTQLSRKTRRLVSEIRSVGFAIANSEFDALLLENNLIKENQPKYNILLKDDKTFPYILIIAERFPRIITTRKFEPGNGEYFGPYSSVAAMNNVLELLRKLFTIRTCKYHLSEKNITAGKFKICLEHHIGNCQGPCEGLQEEGDYLKDIESARYILKGNLGQVRTYFKEHMENSAAALEFEKAQHYKEKIELLEKFQSRSLIVNPKITDTDVFSIVSDEQYAYVNYLKIVDGAVVLTKTVEVKKKLDETEDILLTQIAFELRRSYHSESRELLTNIPISDIDEKTINTLPKIGDKKKLVDLSVKNALYYKKDQMMARSVQRQSKSRNEVLALLKADLRMTEEPDHIECFDNSNLQGSNPVASMVCFKDGKPSKKDYRHFHVKTVEGPDDFASMREIVYRRYKRLMDEEKPLPKLIVIDGGKGQLSAACDALKDVGVYGQMPIIGIAKRLEEIYFPEDPLPLHISKKSPSLHLIQRLRDEAHRFAITFHRKKRSQQQVDTELDHIKGIGKNSIDKLLLTFKSVRKIREASAEEITEVVGKHKANVLQEYFRGR